LSKIQKGIKKKLIQLGKKHSEAISKYQIVCFWDEESNVLSVKSKKKPISMEIEFTEDKIMGSLEAPFLIIPFLGKYEESLIKIILKEIKTI